MMRLGGVSGRFRKRLLTASGWMAIAVPATFVLATTEQSQAQSQAQNTAANPLAFEYDVASIKPSKTEIAGMIVVGMRNTPDGVTATNVPLLFLLQSAYGVNTYQILGVPSWFNSDRYDVNAKMDSPVAEALEKLSPDDRTLARQQMLQKLLAERCKLTIHRDTKEFPIYTLVVAKNGPKLQESKSEDSNPAPGEANGRGGRGGTGISMKRSGEGLSLTGKAVSIENLVGTLTASLRSTVLDKTGLTGKYDFTLQWTPDLDAGIDGSSASESPWPSIFAALQQQLGLKLESAKGPLPVIVIDHVERPSPN